VRAVSDRFLAALRGSHRMVSRATLLTSYQEGTTPTGTDLPVLGGDVRSSAQADIRSTLDMTTDGTGWDFTPGAALTPYGSEIFIERGIVFGGGTVEWVSQGYFRIYEVEQEDAPDGPLRIAGRDRMSGIVDARFEAPRQFLKTATYGDVFDQLVTEVYPDATIEWDDDLVSTALGRTVVAEEEDRYAFLRDMVRSRGKILYWDYAGVLQVKDTPDPTSAVWEVNAGEAGVLVSLGRKLDREGVYNAVVAVGEGSDTTAPARGVARDVNPDSPTNYYGAFGPVPRFHFSPFYLTNTQARSGARSILTAALGRPHAVDFSSIPNPALEVFDAVNLRPGSSSEIHVLDDIALSLLASGPMTAATRGQFAAEVEEE
jgi:hypothetical protein